MHGSSEPSAHWRWTSASSLASAANANSRSSAWTVWDAAKGALVDPLREDSTATIAWLAVHVGHRVGLGGHEHEWTGETNLLLTYHACLRAAQRKGVRTVPDLLAALHEVWTAFGTRPDGCRRLRLADGSVAVLEPDWADASRWIVKTILAPDMVALSAPQMAVAPGLLEAIPDASPSQPYRRQA